MYSMLEFKLVCNALLVDWKVYECNKLNIANSWLLSLPANWCPQFGEHDVIRTRNGYEMESSTEPAPVSYALDKLPPFCKRTLNMVHTLWGTISFERDKTRRNVIWFRARGIIRLFISKNIIMARRTRWRNSLLLITTILYFGKIYDEIYTERAQKVLDLMKEPFGDQVPREIWNEIFCFALQTWIERPVSHYAWIWNSFSWDGYGLALSLSLIQYARC